MQKSRKRSATAMTSMSSTKRSAPSVTKRSIKRYRKKVVKGDGSCFFRAVYQSAHSSGLLSKVCAALRVECATEAEFITGARTRLSETIRENEDGGYVASAYRYLSKLDVDTYKLIINTMPDWLSEAFPEPPKSLRAFRRVIYDSVLEPSNWVGQIEVDLVRALLKVHGMHIDVRYSVLSSSEDMEPNTVYVVNEGETHFNAIWVAPIGGASPSAARYR